MNKISASEKLPYLRELKGMESFFRLLRVAQ